MLFSWIRLIFITDDGSENDTMKLVFPQVKQDHADIARTDGLAVVLSKLHVVGRSGTERLLQPPSKSR